MTHFPAQPRQALTATLDATGDAYAATGKPRPVFSYEASTALAHEIESGASATVVIGSDSQTMDYLAEHELIVPQS